MIIASTVRTELVPYRMKAKRKGFEPNEASYSLPEVALRDPKLLLENDVDALGQVRVHK